jgi:16S rRNA (uracil1498-N3)-methyltransferase
MMSVCAAMAATLPAAMPGSIRLFVSAPLTAGAAIAATPAQAHYLGTVMRRAVGDAVVLFNGRDGEWAAHVSMLRRGDAGFVVERMLRAQASGAQVAGAQAAEPDLWLVFALLKRDATDLVVQKATELGVAALWPVLTAHTGAQRVNLDRLHAIATEAAEQSERLTVPAIHEPRPLAALLQSWPAGRRLLVAAERQAVPPIVATTEPAALLVGPEGGFAPVELDGLRRHPLVTMVSLGPRILRAETAAIAGLARLQGAGCE